MNFKKSSLLVIAVTAILMIALFFGCTPDKSKDEREIIDLVAGFGNQLNKVSLLAPAEIVTKEIQEHYADFLTTELLGKWINSPETAVGRTASSPWPDRIEVSSAEKLSETKYKVVGRIIWITSVEAEKGGADAVQPVELTLIKENGEWKISSVTVENWISED